MIELAYLCMLIGLIWSSVQDLKSCTVSFLPLFLWVFGSMIYAHHNGVGNGLYIMLGYCAILRNYIYPADSVALCASAAWLQISAVPLFSVMTALGCFGLHCTLKSRKVPMLPAIAFGWIVTHFLDACLAGMCFMIVHFTSALERLLCKLRLFCQSFL